MSDSHSSEIWRAIKGYEGLYEVSNWGRVKSLDRWVTQWNRYSYIRYYVRGKILRLGQLKSGHRTAFLWRNGTLKGCCVHRLVLEAFVGPCPKGMQCRHLDGNGGNNYLENLRWGTLKENREDMIVHGTAPRGENNGFAKLTWEKVDEIRRLYKTGEYSCIRLGKMFGVGKHCIGLVVRGKTWMRR